jgi:hypothetical protein
MSPFGLTLIAGVSLRLIIAAALRGSNDMASMEAEGVTLLAGLPIYSNTPGNKLPLAYFVSAAMVMVSRLSGLPASFTLKLPAIAADTLAALVLHRMGPGERTGWRSSHALAAVYLLNPATITLSAYHCNLDPLMAALMVTAVFAWSRGASATGGLLLGAAIAVKTPAALVLLVVLAHSAGAARARVAMTAVAVPLILSLPFALTDPGFTRVFAYSSLYGNWGISLMLKQSENVLKQFASVPPALTAILESANRHGSAAGRYILLAILIGWLVDVARRRRGPDVTALVRDIAATFMVFYVFASGFGVQYLSWAVPFILLASRRLGILFISAITPCLAGTYIQASLPAKYGVESITQNLRLLSSVDLAFLVANGLAGLAAWAACAVVLYRLRWPARRVPCSATNGELGNAERVDAGDRASAGTIPRRPAGHD